MTIKEIFDHFNTTIDKFKESKKLQLSMIYYIKLDAKCNTYDAVEGILKFNIDDNDKVNCVLLDSVNNKIISNIIDAQDLSNFNDNDNLINIYASEDSVQVDLLLYNKYFSNFQKGEISSCATILELCGNARDEIANGNNPKAISYLNLIMSCCNYKMMYEYTTLSKNEDLVKYFKKFEEENKE